MFTRILRSIIFYAVFISGTFIISASVVILGYLPGTTSLIRKLELCWAKLSVFVSGVKLQVEKSELKKEENYIFLANHQSNLDIPIILSSFSEFFPRFLAKESLFKIPFFGPGMRKTGHIPIDRENKRKGMQALQAAVQRAKAGESILIFPEGTRNPKGDKLQEFQIGAFIIILKSGLPVVPLIINGTNKILPKGSKFVQKGTVQLLALSPMDISNYSIKERERLKEDMRELMQNKFLEMKQNE